MSYSFSKLGLRDATVLKIYSFTNILQEFWLIFKQLLHLFLKFSGHFFYKEPFNNYLWLKCKCFT